ncbi:hypothetical protein [Paenibacillus sp. 453mf]|uniref:hypothetical protein n=1 Tax=Paenibacillus sp. 453mf TaxID=1761874 RepID=UPI0008E83333|nr:hypothetical protein [Paenibacillus sp. 453mf]SFS96507.1 hypothetical protein SAMN04488601_1112 [Paenibacillus sp. 453mf]
MPDLNDYGKLIIIYFNEECILICPHHPVIKVDGGLLGFGDEGPVSELERNPSIERLQYSLLENFNNSNQYFLNEFPKRLGIEQYLKVKSYRAATKDKNIVTILSSTFKYSISAHKTLKPSVFVPTETFEITQEEATDEHLLAKKVLEAMEMSI